LISLYLRYDKEYYIYNRQVYALLQYLGDVGGLQQMMYLAGLMLVSYFRQRLFDSSLMKEMYQMKFFRGIRNEEKRVAIKPEVDIEDLGENRDATSWDNSVPTLMHNESSFHIAVGSNRQMLQKKGEDIYSSLKYQQSLEDKDLKTILMTLINRKRLTYTFYDILHFLFSCMCLRNLKDKKSKGSYKKHYLY
jgi:hypothetical protein